MRSKKPPRLAEWIVRRLSRYENRFSLNGDLTEVFEDIVQKENERRARSWYWSQTRRALMKYPVFSWRMHMGMLKNHIKLALRSMQKRKGYTFINLVGLAAGLACCMIILVYVNHELSYDMYHPDVERIYRVLEYRKVPAGEFIMSGISPMVAVVLDEQFTQVEQTVRIMPVSNILVRSQGIPFYEDRVMYTDASLLDVFSISVLRGNPEEALKYPDRAVLTSSLAKKYFGDEDPIGKELEIIDPLQERVWGDNRRLRVTVSGVVADPPSNSHVKHGILLSLQVFRDHPILSEWHAGMTHTYVKLAPNTQLADFEKAIERLAYDYVSRDLSAWGQTREYFVQPMKDIHFCGKIRGLPVRDELEPPGNRSYFYIYGVIAMLILLIGTMNFINLSNARAVHRIKEVGLRKVLGAKRRELIRQFLSESVLITIFASGFGFLLARVLLPFFVAFSGSTVSYSALFQPRLLVATAGLVLSIGLLSGIYPAFVLTTFKPDRVLRGTSSWTRGSSALRVLVVGQFVISIFLAVGTLTVSSQLGYMQRGDLGFQTEAQFVIPFRRNGEIRKQVKALKTELLKHPQVLSAAASSSSPGRPMQDGHLKWSDDKLDKPLKLVFLSCDEDFIPQFRIGMAAGRAFDAAKNDENSAFLINEAAVKYLGYASMQRALGDRLYEGWNGHWKTIVGVTKNFHYRGMQSEVEPMFMEVSPSRYDMLTVNLVSADLSQTLRFIENTWRGFWPDIPFEGFFLEDDFNRQYLNEMQMGRMLGILTMMGLVISCMGLLGLASFLVQHRMKEIGIRKVLGASVPDVMVLLSKQFLFLVMIANGIAVPIAYMIAVRWLEDFAYRIRPSWFLFAVSGGTALFLALMAVGFHALHAARANPVDSLRYE